MHTRIQPSCRCGYKDDIYIEQYFTKEEYTAIGYRYYVFDQKCNRLIQIISKSEIENPELFKEHDVLKRKFTHCPKCKKNQADEETLSVRLIFCTM